jgi:photosystem II PsbK protein
MESLFLSKLPGAFAIFGPLADIMPIIPILFFLLAWFFASFQKWGYNRVGFGENDFKIRPSSCIAFTK